jgi:integrase
MTALERTRTPGIYKRGGRYVVTWRHRGRQHKSFHRTYEEAREAKGRRQSGESRPSSRRRFEEYFENWIESYSGRTARGLTDGSRELYRRSVEDQALARWGDWRLGEIEPVDVRALYREMRELGVSTSGMRGLRAALSALFATALEDGLVATNPVRGVRIPPPLSGPQAPRRKSLTEAELSKLLAELPENWRLFFEFMTHTGLRISEALGLQWRHLELGGSPRVIVREQLHDGDRRRLKSARARREVPLSPRMAARLRALRQLHSSGEEAPVFATATGTALNRANLAARILKPAAKRAGLSVEEDGEQVTWVSFHTFRHTCASLLFAQGRNVKQVAEWLGHSDPSFTLRTYVHLMDAGVGDAAFFDRLLTEAG